MNYQQLLSLGFLLFGAIVVFELQSIRREQDTVKRALVAISSSSPISDSSSTKEFLLQWDPSVPGGFPGCQVHCKFIGCVCERGPQGVQGIQGIQGIQGVAGIGGMDAGGFFGSGRMGVIDLNGTLANTVSAYIQRTGMIYTMLQDVYASNLTLSAGAVLITNNYRLYVSEYLTLGNQSIIHNDGISASWYTAVSARASGTIWGGGNGAAGGNSGGDGKDADAVSPCSGGRGGNGGSSPGRSAGDGAVCTPPTIAQGGAFVTHSAAGFVTRRTLDGIPLRGGQGGGGGAAQSSGSNGGAGGSGAGGLHLEARWIRLYPEGSSTVKATIRANGGNGANAMGNNAGGGGGGGAGEVGVLSKTNLQPLLNSRQLIVESRGGTGGLGKGVGTAGVNGQDWTVLIFDGSS